MEQPLEADSSPKKWSYFAVAALSAFMATLDSSIVNVALPTLAAEFDVDVKVVAWVVQSYLLTTMALLLVSGRLLDLFGARRVFVVGFSFFTVGSAFCAMSFSISMLILARAFQGIGAAVLMGANQGLIAHSFPAARRGRVLGLIGTVVSIGLASGPPLGGLLIGLLGWRSIFYVNIPVGIWAILHAQAALGSDSSPPPASRQQIHDSKIEFDWPGAAMIVLGLAALFCGMHLGVGNGWESAEAMILILVSLIILGFFLVHERRIVYPIVTLSIFRNRFFTQSCAAAFLAFLAMIAAVILMPFYLQEVLRLTPQRVGLIMMALPLSMLLVAPLAGLLSDRVGTRLPASFGLILVGAGLFWLQDLGPATGTQQVVWRLGLIGVGMGFFGSPNSNAILSSVPPSSVGIASGLSALMRTSGVAFGTAFSATLFTYFRDRASLVSAHATAALQGVDGERLLYIEGIVPVFGVAAFVMAANVLNSLLRGRPGRIAGA